MVNIITMNIKKDYYVYVYFNQTKSGVWNYNEHTFTHQPFYVGKGRNKRDIINNKLKTAYGYKWKISE